MEQNSTKTSTPPTKKYNPFVRGQFPVGVRTVQAFDEMRNRLFPCEIWYPATEQYIGQDISPQTQHFFTTYLGSTRQSQMAVRDAVAMTGIYPLILFSHHSGGHKRAATFLCTHLSSHGYIVAALDHSEVVALELARKDKETHEQKFLRRQAIIDNRVPDIQFLLRQLLNGLVSEINFDPTQIGIVGHSLGGWTALATTDVENSISAVVALAPGGSSNPKPGILPLKLNFSWGRDVPTLYLVAENDVSLPLSGMYQIFEKTPATKQMVILRRADHLHFIDNIEQVHEIVRTMTFPDELAWLPKEMRPISELCSEQQAHFFVQGLTLSHMDAVLKRQVNAQEFWLGNVKAQLTKYGVDALVHNG